MSSQAIEFTNAAGRKLAGRLDLPDGREPHATALFAHCFTCNKDLKSVTRISRTLNAAGIAVFRFDFTGLGDSEGEFADTNFTTSVDDLLAAAEYLAGLGRGPEIAIGHSLGGAAVLVAAPRIESLRAVVTIGAPGRADHVTHLFAGDREALAERGEAVVDIGGRPFRIKQQLVDDLEAQSGPDRAARLRIPLLVMHSPLDTVVGIDNAAEIFEHALHPKSFVSLDPADHLLSEARDATFAGAMIAAWAGRYTGTAADVTDERPVPHDGNTAVAETGATGFRTEVLAQGHRLVADEPAGVGGTDAGPSPYGLLGAALASCTSMTLQMYARHKGLALDTVTVTVDHSKVHAEDCEHCESKSGKIDRFDRRIALGGDLSEAERARLLEIADKCPVHRTLASEVEIRTTPG